MLSINVVSYILIFIYFVSYFFIRRKKDINLFCVFLIFFMPKINLISVGSMTTAGIRVDDLIILMLLLKNLNRVSYKNEYAQRGIKFLFILTLSNAISIFTGIIIGLNSNMLYPLLVVVRKFEYFSLIFVGYNIARKYRNRLVTIEKEYIRLNLYLAVVGLLQLAGLCNYAVSGGESEIFSGFVVSTFNGYYEYGQFLIFSLIYFMLKIPKSNNRVKYICLFMLSLILLYYTNSRTSLLCFAIIFVLYLLMDNSREKNFSIFKLAVVFVSSIGALLLFTGIIKINLGRLANISGAMLASNFIRQLKQTSFNEYYSMVRNGIRVTSKLGATNDLSTSIRFFKWSAAIDGFFKYPLFGYGIGITHVMDGHYIRLLGETGITGLTIWLAFFTYYVRLFKSNKNRKILYYFIYLSMLSVMVSATFIDMFDASKIMEFLWLFVGCGCFLITDDEKEKTE